MEPVFIVRPEGPETDIQLGFAVRDIRNNAMCAWFTDPETARQQAEQEAERLNRRLRGA